MKMEHNAPKINLPVTAMSSGETLTMSSREIAALVESRHDNVKVAIERLAERGIITFTAMQEKSKGGRPSVVYHVNKRDSFVVVAQLCPEFTARLVDRWQELEQEKAKGGLSLPDFSNPVAAARAWADAQEARMIAEQTKAEIGSRREATAMNTASQAVKRANRLEKQLDRAQQYATIKRMEDIHQRKDFNWRHLKKAAEELGLPSIDTFDQNYGSVKAYHADVWQKVYAVDVRGVMQ